MRLLWLAVALSLGANAQNAPAPDVQDIVRRSVERDAANFQRFRDYTFHETTEETRYDKRGGVDKTETETVEVLMLAGRPYTRLIARDGLPLAEKEARKEQEKLDKELQKRLKDPEKQQAKFEKERAEERRFLREIPDAFDLTLVGVEMVDGLPAWKIHAEPKPGYKPREKRAGVFKKLRATIWIDQAEYQWVKADVDVIETISWGWFVLRIPPGAKISFSQTRVNDEVWLPKEIRIRADARLGLLKTFRMGLDVAYNDYRKFQAESQVVDVQEISTGQ
jgi:hypothetical protein